MQRRVALAVDVTGAGIFLTATFTASALGVVGFLGLGGHRDGAASVAARSFATVLGGSQRVVVVPSGTVISHRDPVASTWLRTGPARGQSSVEP